MTKETGSASAAMTGWMTPVPLGLHRTLKCNILSLAVAESPTQLVTLQAHEPQAFPLFGLSTAELSKCMVEAGEPAFRGRQLAEALYRNWADRLDEISTLPRELRLRLGNDHWTVGRPRIAQVFRSVDGTERYLVEGQAGPETVETVWMPEGDEGETGDTEGDSGSGKNWNRATICVSSQVGCAVNCQFCLTARLGLQRNLTAGEIAGQVVAVLDRHKVSVGRDRVNLVFMGMGEPFLNYDSFMGAVKLLVNEVRLSPQRMTVSTSGIVPAIERFTLEPPEIRPKLAVSLNAPNNEIRSGVMPINRKWPIEALVEAVRGIKLRPRERVTFEYVLLGGITDQPQHARELARLIRSTGLPVKVNLIAWNPGPDVPYRTPDQGAVELFRGTLTREGIPAYLRRPRGRDIYAACGQLKRTVEG